MGRSEENDGNMIQNLYSIALCNQPKDIIDDFLSTHINVAGGIQRFQISLGLISCLSF